MDGSESAARCLTAGEKAAVIMSQNRFYAAAMMATFASLLEFTSSPVDHIALAGIPDFFFRAPMSDMVELYTRPNLSVRSGGSLQRIRLPGKSWHG